MPDDARDQTGLRKAPVGDQQGPRDAIGPACVRKLGDAPGAGDDARRKIPGPGDLNCHVVFSVFDAKMK
jgi:hypothetical protein